MQDLINRDLNRIWHPCSQMKEYEQYPPIAISHAEKEFIYTDCGHRLIDATSSWWCKSLGHNVSALNVAINQQSQAYAHVISAGTVSRVLVELSETLCGYFEGLNKVFYTSDGSCAVEVALKLALHYQQLQANEHRTQFIALENAYHGETIGAMSVSDCGIYKSPYQSLLFDCTFLKDLPYVNSIDDSLWHDCETYWPGIEAQLSPLANRACALIVEPIVQGAGGMRIYSQDLLKRLRHWCSNNNVILIADEIMTGFGRTGLPFACHHAQIAPDIAVLGKGLTAGMLPMSAVLIAQRLYDRFYNDYCPKTAFLHSHTHTGNALGASVALAAQKIYKENQFFHARAGYLNQYFPDLKNRRHIGFIVAGSLENPTQHARIGAEYAFKARQLGGLVRPLGDILYWLPPLNIQQQSLKQLREIHEDISLY